MMWLVVLEREGEICDVRAREMLRERERECLYIPLRG
jgi:hypothetical protein